MKKILALSLLAGVVVTANAQSFTENFDVITGVPTTPVANYTLTAQNAWEVRNFSLTQGTSNWFQGTSTVFPSQAGPANGYVGVNYNTTTGSNAINTFLMSQVRTFNNGDLISFWTRTVNAPAFPDRLQLRFSLAGASTNAADFSTVALTVNPTLTTSGYPSIWTQYSVTLAGLGAPTSGRFAFNYNMPNAGPLGSNSDYIGIDTVAYQAVPEPATMAALGLGALAVIRRRRASK
jgi:hypothetical protein